MPKLRGDECRVHAGHQAQGCMRGSYILRCLIPGLHNAFNQ